MHKTIHLACLLVIFIFLMGCSARKEEIPPKTVTASPAVLPVTKTIPAESMVTDTPLPAYPPPYPTPPNGYPAYPAPSEYPAPGPEMGYPAEELTLTAQAPTLTQAPSPTAIITPTITITPTLGPPTITALPTGKALPELPVPCDVYVNSGRSEHPLLNLNNLRWEEVSEDSKPVQRLTGFSTSVGQVVPSPDGSGVALPIILSSIDQTVKVGLLVVDGPGKKPWLAMESEVEMYFSFQWLPGNRLIWINDGNLYSAMADGSSIIHYELSEHVSRFWSNGALAMVSGERNLWMLDLKTKIWTVKVENGSLHNASAVLSPDGKWLLVNDSGTLLQIPMDTRSQVIKYKTLQYQGSGGSLQPPVAMVGSPYIYPGVLELFDGPTPKLRFVVFRSGEFDPIPIETLIGKAEVLNIYAMNVSKDGKWVIFSFLSSDPSYPDASYLAPSNNLKSGKIITDSNLGWRASPPTVFLLKDGLLKQVFLPGFKEKILGSFSYWTERPNLFQVRVGANVTAVLHGSQLFMFDANGKLQTKYDLPYHNEQLVSLTPGRNGTFYLVGWDGKPNGDICEATYWMEIIGKP